MLKVDILRYCSLHGITNVQLAKSIGLIPQNIKATIGKNPKAEVVCRCADALGVSPMEFFYETDDKGNAVGESMAQMAAREAQENAREAQDKAREAHGAAVEHETGVRPAAMKVGMVICPHCHCGIEITGVVVPATDKEVV